MTQRKHAEDSSTRDAVSIAEARVAVSGVPRRPVASLVWVSFGMIALTVPMAMWSSTYAQQVGFRVMIYVAIAQAWNLLAGYGGMIFLGTAAFVGVGEYAFIEASNHGMAVMPAVAFAGLASVTLAIVISPALFRLRGLYFAVGTWAFAQALLLLVSTITTFGGSTGLFLKVMPPSYATMYWYSLLLAVATGVVVLLVLRSRLSVALRGVRDDQDVAEEMGVRVFRTKLTALMIAALVMGVVGAIQCLNDAFVEPTGAFSMGWAVYPLVAVIIGGMATRLGPWIGALAIVGLGEALANYSDIHDLITGIILIVVIRFLPRGVWGSLCAGWRRWTSVRRTRSHLDEAPR